ncbi:MAG TPA: hypothetical protein DCX54_13625 [Flavobacteriales bacterium]|nr:hypothetical protein [Flavobacteriales bacterium]
MKKVLRFVAVLAIPALMSSCITMSGISVSDVAAGGGSMVSGKASGMGFLALTVPAAADLERQAMEQAKANGATKNLTARLTMRNLVIVQLYAVEVTGDK